MEWIGIGLLLLGLVWLFGFAFVHFRAIGKARASETWPTVMGKVISSEVIVEEDKSGEGATWYNPVVAYSYSVAGNAHQGNRIRFANMRRGSRRKAEEILGRYPSGASVAVRYNPEKAQEAVLESQTPGPLYLILALGGLVFAAVGAFFLAAR